MREGWTQCSIPSVMALGTGMRIMGCSSIPRTIFSFANEASVRTEGENAKAAVSTRVPYNPGEAVRRSA